MEELTLDDIPVAIMVVDRGHIIKYTNTKIAGIFGYEPSELIGKDIDILVPEDFKAKHHHQIEEFYGNPVTRPLGIGRDLCGLCKDGTLKRIEISLTPIVIRGEECTLVTVIDVNIRKFLENVHVITELMKKTTQSTLDVLDEKENKPQ